MFKKFISSVINDLKEDWQYFKEYLKKEKEREIESERQLKEKHAQIDREYEERKIERDREYEERKRERERELQEYITQQKQELAESLQRYDEEHRINDEKIEAWYQNHIAKADEREKRMKKSVATFFGREDRYYQDYPDEKPKDKNNNNEE